MTASTISHRYLLLSVFMAGMTSLAVEMAGSRLLQNIFGTSNLVWANVIGLILVYLTAGYFLGGRLADRSPRPETFYRVLAWAGFTAGLIPLVAQPILRLAAGAFVGFGPMDLALVLGSFAAVLVLFAIPVTLLGCVSPFAIRLALHDVSAAGQTAGRIYAISTLGSLIGTFAPVLLLIPEIGTARTFLVFAGALLFVALIGLARLERRRAVRYLWMPALLAALAVLTLSGPIRPVAGLRYETESAYNLIQVVDGTNGWRYLLLNEGQGLHSAYNPAQLATNAMWDYFLVAPYFNAPPYESDRVRSLAVVGLAAGTISRQYTAVYGPIPIDGIEIDPEIVRVGREWFGMNQPNLKVIIGDGRYVLAHSDKRYDVVGIDAYRLPYIPWHLTTREWFEEVRQHLTADGAVAINVGRTPDDRRLVEALCGTLESVFPSVYVMDVPDTLNSVVVATMQPTRVENLRANLEALPPGAPEFLRQTLARGAAALQPTPASLVVFTDDWAPVEQWTNSLIVRYLLEVGGVPGRSIP